MQRGAILDDEPARVLSRVPLLAGLDRVTLAKLTIACNGFVVPCRSTIYLALYRGRGGRLFDHRLARPAALAYGVASLLALCASVPAWRWMGFL